LQIELVVVEEVGAIPLQNETVFLSFLFTINKTMWNFVRVGSSHKFLVHIQKVEKLFFSTVEKVTVRVSSTYIMRTK
jgi:hypothetical protein